MEFPSVTVCNLNQFRKSKIKDLPEIYEQLESYLNPNRKESSDFDKKFSTQTNSFKKDASLNSDINDDNTALDNVEIKDNYILGEIIAQATSDYEEDELMKVGHQFKNLLLECSWMGLDCKTG